MTFAIVIFIALSYVLLYFLAGLAMNIVLFISDDFRKLTSETYSCPSNFVKLYVVMDISPIVMFGSGYFIIEFITRRLRPIITDYTFNKGQYQVKMVTFNNPLLKGMIVMIDLCHIVTAIAFTSMRKSSPRGALVCEEEFPTFSKIAAAYSVLGYLAIGRFLYLVFPHLVGEQYFSYK